MDRLLFGKSFQKIHREMDKPFKTLRKRHRILNHDYPTAAMIAKKCYPRDPKAVQAAWYHIYLDKRCTADPNLKDLLEAMVRIDRMKRRRKRRSFM